MPTSHRPLILAFMSLVTTAQFTNAVFTSSMLGNWTATNVSTSNLLILNPTLLSITNSPDSSFSFSFEWTDTSNHPTVHEAFTVPASTQQPATLNKITARVFSWNVFSGIEYVPGNLRTVSTDAISPTTIHFTSSALMLTQQGSIPKSQLSYSLSLDVASSSLSMVVSSFMPFVNTTIRYSRLQPPFKPLDSPLVPFSTRSPPVVPFAAKFTTQVDERESNFEGPGKSSAFSISLPNTWKLVDPSFQLNAMCIGLQGLLNRDTPTLYIVYPPGWDFTYTPEVKTYFEKTHNFSFTNFTDVTSLALALVHKAAPRGFILWDPTVRESLAVAYTAAGTFLCLFQASLHITPLSHLHQFTKGVLDGLVATPEMIPLMQQLGLVMLQDFSTRFRAKTPVEIYSTAREMFWEQTSKTYIMWAGGACPTTMQPGFLDFAVANR